MLDDIRINGYDYKHKNVNFLMTMHLYYKNNNNNKWEPGKMLSK